jgi:hypothetical protein
MDEICICNLGTDALDFFHGELGQAGPIPSTLIPEYGRLWCYLPRNAIEKQTLSDLRGGAAFNAEEAYEILQRTVTFIADFLQQNPSNILLCEDRFFAINDRPNLSESQIFEHVGVTYHYHTGATLAIGSGEIEEEIGSASSYPLVLLLTSIPSGEELPVRAAIGKDLVEQLAHNVRHVVLGAFDEEGYIIWSKLNEIV